MTECKFCDFEIVDIHHIIPKEFGGKNDLDNLMDLCPNHHRCFHLLMRMEKLIRDPMRSKTDFRCQQLSRKCVFIQTHEGPFYSWFLSLVPRLKNAFLSDVEIFNIIKEKKRVLN